MGAPGPAHTASRQDRQQLPTFSAVFDKIVSGYEQVGRVAEKGAGFSLLATGMIVLVGTFAIKIIAIVATIMKSGAAIEPSDFAIAAMSGILLMFGGSALRVWERYLVERSKERETQLRLKAAEQVTSLLAPLPTDAGTSTVPDGSGGHI